MFVRHNFFLMAVSISVLIFSTSGCMVSEEDVGRINVGALTLRVEPSVVRMNPFVPKRLGVNTVSSDAFELMQSTPDVAYRWSIERVEGHKGFGNDVAALSTIRFVDPKVLNPRMVVDMPDFWPNDALVYLKLAVTYLGNSNYNKRFLPDVDFFY